MKKALKIIAGALVALVVVCGVAFGVYTSDYYHADALAQEALATSLTCPDKHLEFPAQETVRDENVGIIFYPGGKVEASAYAPLAQECAERGITFVICPMPFNLAFFGVNAANAVMKEHPEVTSWYIAGHSLGGVAASLYADNNADKLAGAIFLASYPSKDLTDTNLRTLSLYGENDGVLAMDKYQDAVDKFLTAAEEVVIPGGNHCGFGSYGFQKGDNPSTLDSDDQIQQTADAIAEFVTQPTYIGGKGLVL